MKGVAPEIIPDRMRALSIGRNRSIASTMIPRFLHAVPVGISLLFSPAIGLAGVAEDLVVLHIEAIGGQDAANALKSVHKKGHNLFGERRIPISVWGATPNRIRIEMQLNEETTLIQGCDGIEVWQVRVRNGKVEEAPMSADERRQFFREAWFRGPLFGDGTGTLDLVYAGIAEIGESRGFLIEVKLEGTNTCAVLIADDNYQLVARKSEQVIRGRRVPVVQHYSEFGPVAGVWLPHRVESNQEDLGSVVTVFDSIVPNPELPPGIFDKPGIR